MYIRSPIFEKVIDDTTPLCKKAMLSWSCHLPVMASAPLPPWEQPAWADGALDLSIAGNSSGEAAPGPGTSSCCSIHSAFLGGKPSCTMRPGWQQTWGKSLYSHWGFPSPCWPWVMVSILWCGLLSPINAYHDALEMSELLREQKRFVLN